MNLSSEDVQDILHLLDDSQYDELHLTTSSFTLSLRRSASGGWTQEHQALSAPAVTQDSATAQGAPPADTPSSAPQQTPVREGLHAVRAPLPGTFYRAPKPGAEPFVELGTPVDEDTVVGIVEVMKLMNSVYAGVRGRVAEICLDDAEAAAQDAVVMLVENEAR